MKKLWKKLEERRERVGRGRRLAFNLTFSALFLCLTWVRLGCPLPTAEMEFRRLERTHLLPRSEVVFSNGGKSKDGLQVSGEDGSVFALDGTELHLRGRWVVGMRGDQAVVALLHRNRNNQYIRSCPLDSGPSLVPLLGHGEYLDHSGYWVTHGPGETPEGDPAYVYHYHNFAPFLLLNVPEGISGAEITVRLEGEEHSGGGWQLADDVWLLGIELERRLGDEPVDETAYTLRLYRADRSLLLEKSGTLGEG